jgi:hypothetical protein
MAKLQDLLSFIPKLHIPQEARTRPFNDPSFAIDVAKFGEETATTFFFETLQDPQPA